jgi:PilZ domain
MLEKRKVPRRKMVLPVKVSTDKDTLLAYTVDITDGGARLGGLRANLELGMIISLQRGSHKAKFRVAWVQEIAANELRAGVECLEPNSNFWGVNLRDRDEEAKKDMQALMTLLTSNVSKNPTV